MSGFADSKRRWMRELPKADALCNPFSHVVSKFPKIDNHVLPVRIRWTTKIP